MLRSVIGTRLDQITLIVGATVTLYVLALLLQPEAIMEASGFLSILSPGGRALYWWCCVGTWLVVDPSYGDLFTWRPAAHFF